MSLAELRRVLKSEKVVYGSSQTIRDLKKNKIKKIFLSSDCMDRMKSDIRYYSKFNKVEIVELKQPSDELALICKKGYPVTVISY